MRSDPLDGRRERIALILKGILKPSERLGLKLMRIDERSKLIAWRWKPVGET